MECPSNTTEWYDVFENAKMGVKKKGKDDKEAAPTPLGQVRVEIVFTPGVETVDEDRLKGIVKKVRLIDHQNARILCSVPLIIDSCAQGKWTVENAGGSLIADKSKWFLNPQFLLTMKSKGTVTIELSHRAKVLRFLLWSIRRK